MILFISLTFGPDAPNVFIRRWQRWPKQYRVTPSSYRRLCNALRKSGDFTFSPTNPAYGWRATREV